MHPDHFAIVGLEFEGHPAVVLPLIVLFLKQLFDINIKLPPTPLPLFFYSTNHTTSFDRERHLFKWQCEFLFNLSLLPLAPALRIKNTLDIIIITVVITIIISTCVHLALWLFTVQLTLVAEAPKTPYSRSGGQRNTLSLRKLSLREGQKSPPECATTTARCL